ncbi:MAG TPA: DUF1552 domain-containing protein [Chthonomonadales bacterium]|nr:DUF1552 domain-containing protein [Chthonomonadales bacterium]
MSYRSIPRRTFLKGVGAAVALPALESLLPRQAFGAAAVPAPRRVAFLFTPNGMHMPAWTPATDGPNYVLPNILEPLKDLRPKFNVLTGLTQHNAFALGDGGGDHARSTAVFLTGVHPHKTDGTNIQAGLSVDQLAARKLGHKTLLPSLELGCERGAQAGDCDSGYSCAYSSSIAWSTPTDPVPHEVDPRAVFERLFGDGDPSEKLESRQKRDRYRQSILDLVLDDAASLKRRLGAHDQEKMDEYLSGIREVEQRIVSAEHTNRFVDQNGLKKPSGVPAQYQDHLRLMYDMLALAFRADLTRVATFMVANDGSNRSYRFIGVPEGHHDMSHHGGDPVKQDKIRQINRFHATELARFLAKLDSIQEPGGSVLDHSMIVYGAGISDGNAHNHDNLPILLAGSGGGTIRTGRHVTYTDGTPLTNLFISILDRMGIPAEHVGDSSGRLQDLL